MPQHSYSLRLAIRTACSVACATALAPFALAAETQHVEEIMVMGFPSNKQLMQDSMADRMKLDGINFYQSGGIAALPVMNGLNDDRIRVTVDGASITSACANHMNPVLSYVDFGTITDITVIAGITPVSVGGDSIAGTISLQTEQFRFAEHAGINETDGKLGYDYDSNGQRQRVNLQGAYREKNFSLQYSGFTEQSDSYKDGAGNTVLNTLYRAESHSVTASFQGENQQLAVKVAHQSVPYQGFPNQYMDMVGNDSNSININHYRDFSWGKLHSQAAWQQVDHEMGFFTAEKTGTMPMITEGRDINYSIKAEIPLQANHTLTLGHEYFLFTLNDYWPAVAGSMMMGPNTYVNINDGERSRIALFAESDLHFTEQWSLLSGIRVEKVDTNVGDVQPYNSSMIGSMPNLDAAAANAFNKRSHKMSDDNIDLSLMLSYTPNDSFKMELGYAQKTRSPSLYERYSWGRGTMAMTMIGWYGDANGYLGDINLSPETAHTLGAKLSWADPVGASWHVEVSPYYTKVDQFIDANVIGTFNPRMQMQVTRPLLQFTNLDATLYGTRVNAHTHLGKLANWGMWDLSASLNYQRGERDADNSDLYQIMPFQFSLALEQRLGDLQQRLSVDWVDAKSRVDTRRMEPQTAGYTLLNWQAQYQWSAIAMSLQVSNLLDKTYDLPLGGVHYAKWLTQGMQGQYEALAGQGRSFNMGVQYQF